MAFMHTEWLHSQRVHVKIEVFVQIMATIISELGGNPLEVFNYISEASQETLNLP